MSLQRLPLILVLFLCLIVSVAVAQAVTKTLEGHVTDPTGAAITICNTETGQERTLKSNGEGFYSAPFLSLGQYRVTAGAAGFGIVAREGVRITLNQTIVINFPLRPAAAQETVIIRDEAPPINTTNAEIAQSLSAEQITDRPALNQGSFLTLAQTFTGYQENPTSGQNNPTVSSGSSINFNGTGTRGAPFKSMASTMTTRQKIRTGRAHLWLRSKSSRSSPTTSPPNSGAVTAQSCWCKPKPEPINFTAKLNSL